MLIPMLLVFVLIRVPVVLLAMTPLLTIRSVGH